MFVMNEFQMSTNDEGEYCLKDLSYHFNIKYASLFEKYDKTHITKDELNSFLENFQKRPEVEEFQTKLYIFEKCKWIPSAISLMKKLNINLLIDSLFIILWCALERQTNIKIAPLLLKFMGFCVNDDPLCKNTVCMKKLIKFLKSNKINFEFENTNTGSNLNTSKKMLVLTFDNFKECIMVLNNDRANEVRKYFNQLENIFTNYRIETLLNENEHLSSINSDMQNTLQNVTMRNKDGYIYIATSKSYAAKNLFKIGFTDNLRARLSALNNSKISSDRMYYSFYKKAFCVKKVEKIIHDILEDFRDCSTNEFFKLHHDCLHHLVNLTIDNINQPYEYVNELFKDGMKKSSFLRPVIPTEIEVKGNDELSERKIIETITKLINNYIANGVLKITRRQIFSESLRELQCNLKQREVWKMFKKEFGWKASHIPIKCGNSKITVNY